MLQEYKIHHWYVWYTVLSILFFVSLLKRLTYNFNYDQKSLKDYKMATSSNISRGVDNLKMSGRPTFCVLKTSSFDIRHLFCLIQEMYKYAMFHKNSFY